jgi:RNA polymerase sigma-70 factor, ECF subfamily
MTVIDPDHELLKRVANGDDDAFRTLFERHHRLVYSVIHRHLGNSSAAEDLVQEAFLRVYRHAASWEPTAKFSTWLYTVASNLCLNYKRDRARSKLRLVSGEDDNPLERLPAVEDSEVDAMDAEERSAMVRAAIAELPENQRMALILSRYEDKSYEEVAEILGTTVASVKSLNSRARATLREKLARLLEE